MNDFDARLARRTPLSRAVGSVIRERRIAAGIGQADLAVACGTTQPSVSRWERGYVLPDLAAFLTLHRLLELDLDDIQFEAAS